MFVTGWQIAQNAYELYVANGIIELLLISSLIFLLLVEKRRENIQLVYYFVFLIIIAFCPQIAYVFSNYFIGNDVYWRIFWLLPSCLIIAFAGARVYELLRSRSRKRIFVIALLMIIALGGKFVFNTENFSKTTNLYKLPEEVIEICDMVVLEDEEVKMIVPETIVSYIRQYNPDIKLLYGRSLGKDVQRGKKYKILNQLNSSTPNTKTIAKYAKKQECNFIVFKNTSVDIEKIEKYDYELYGITESYTIFKLAN